MSTRVIPAELSFLAIYNPALGVDETLHDQIVYYYTGSGEAQEGHKPVGDDEPETSHELLNERLRQIGLAQGMIEFAKSFSNGDAVDCVETTKCRVLLHELEPGWWVLASVNLTRLVELPATRPSARVSADAESKVEYSAREVCPPALLLQQLIRAYRIFLLHHSPTLAELYARSTRSRFCHLLERYWDNFVSDWGLLMNGNPAVDVFNGLKLAAGGELGIGVGEEEWGSGEREVLEDFVRRTDGLVDMIVSRFGDPTEDKEKLKSPPLPHTTSDAEGKTVERWQRDTQHARPSDGVVFSGVGAITRSSIKDISSWVELLHKYGQHAYGVRDNPAAIRRRKGEKSMNSPQGEVLANSRPIIPRRSLPVSESSYKTATNTSRQRSVSPPSIPPPIVRSSHLSTNVVNTSPSLVRSSSKGGPQKEAQKEDDSRGGSDTLMKYITLGMYGSTWGIPSRKVSSHEDVSKIQGKKETSRALRKSNSNAQEHSISHGHFLIGLQGVLEHEAEITRDGDEKKANENQAHTDKRLNERTILRTLQVGRYKQRSPQSSSGLENPGDESSIMVENGKVRVVVYVQAPFIFTFLFELHTESLAMPTFYHSIHHQLGPLQRPLLASTSPERIRERLWEASAPKSTSPLNNSEPIWDLVYDPVTLTVHTTIPNIPDLSTASVRDSGAQAVAASWTRAEALSVHSQILNTYHATRRSTLELERTCKTSRGWWVVWLKLPRRPAASSPDGREHSEAFLIRKSSDYPTPAARTGRGLFGLDLGGGKPGSRWGPVQLAEGIGIDARQYIDGILSLNR